MCQRRRKNKINKLLYQKVTNDLEKNKAGEWDKEFWNREL